MQRQALGHNDIGTDRSQDLLLDHRHFDFLAELVFGHLLAGQHSAERRFVELPGNILEARDACDLAVDKPFGNGNADVLAEGQQGLGGDQLLEDPLIGAAGEEPAHVEFGILLARALQLPLHLFGHFDRGQFLVACLGKGRSAASDSAKPAATGAKARDDHCEQGKAKKCQHDLGGGAAPKKGEHL